jgi:hypothetical protein
MSKRCNEITTKFCLEIFIHLINETDICFFYKSHFVTLHTLITIVKLSLKNCHEFARIIFHKIKIYHFLSMNHFLIGKEKEKCY